MHAVMIRSHIKNDASFKVCFHKMNCGVGLGIFLSCEWKEENEVQRRTPGRKRRARQRRAVLHRVKQYDMSVPAGSGRGARLATPLLERVLGNWMRTQLKWFGIGIVTDRH